MKHQDVDLSTKQTLPKGNQAKPAMTRGEEAQDAIDLLEADHAQVDELLKEYEDAAAGEKEALARQICQALTVHAQIEEEIFYPAARDALDEEDLDLLDEADVEHASIKQLVAEVESSSPGDDHYDAKVKVIGEQVEHHVEEEEKELFPKVKKTDLDTKALGAKLAARKAELEAAITEH